MQVTRIEDGLGVRLPDSMVAALKLHEGDEVEISVVPLRSAEDDGQKSVAELLAGLRKYRGTLPKDFRLDREEANERR